MPHQKGKGRSGQGGSSRLDGDRQLGVEVSREHTGTMANGVSRQRLADFVADLEPKVRPAAEAARRLVRSAVFAITISF